MKKVLVSSVLMLALSSAAFAAPGKGCEMSTLNSNGKPQACKAETTEVPELNAGGAAIALALLSGLLMLRRERRS